MKKSYKLNSFTLWGVLTFLLMMFGLHIGAMAQSDDCISEAQPIRTYIFLTTQDGGTHWDTAAVKNIKNGQSVPRPEFTVIDYSTFDAWHTVSDPASFSDDNKFPESNFSTAQSITVTDTLRLYASYTLEVYHVIFMDGVSDEARVFRVWEVVAGTTGLNPNNETVVVDATTRSVGWYYDPALTQHATTFTMPAHDTILYPDIKTGHWLRFLSNGGTYVEPVFYQADATTQAPAEPSRTGYTFNGWLNGTEGWTPGGTLTEDITLTADWVATEVNYTVVYWVENADDQNYSFNNARTVTVAAGTHITTLASGYTATTNIINGMNQHVTTFSYDKNTQADATDVTVAGDGSTVINLYYKRKTYTLTFDPSRYYSSSSSGTSENRASGQTTATITAKYGANIWNQFPISRNIRAFLSFITHSTSMWKATNTNVYSYALQTISTMPGANVTFYLYYNGNETEHTIYYDLENIEGTGYDRKAVSTFFNFVTYTEEYCDIQGFSKQTEAEAGFNNQHRKDFGSDGTVTLLYFRNSYAIRFYNGGEELNSLQETRKYEQEIGTLPVLSDADAPAGKTGFTFGGWYQNELCEGDSISSTSTMPAAEVVLYAKWNAPQYTATIHLTTSPSGETNDISVAYGETVPESELATAHPCPGSEPAAGWTILNEDGSTTVFEGDMLIYRDITLVPYCLLTGERYTITYNMNCAGVPAVDDNNEYADGSNPMVLPPSKDSCDNNTFLGWEEITTDGDYIVHSPYNGIYMTGDKTLSALWGSATEHTVVEMVEHHPTDGDVTASLEVITNGTTLLELPTTFERDETDRPNDWFIGWSQNENAQVAEFGPGESVVLSCDATIYPVWMQITPNDLNRTVCAGTEMDMNEFDAFSIHTDDYTHGLASNIVDSIWSITKDGEEFTAHEDGLITNAEPGIYVVSLTLKTAKNVEKTFSNTIRLSVVEQFEPVFNSLQTLICQGYSVDLPQGSEEAAVSGSDNVIPSVLGKWMATDDSGSPVEVYRVPTDEVGRITLTFVPDEGQCASEISVDFTVVAPPAVVIEGDQLICSTDGSVMLTATVNPLSNDETETYQWMRQMEDGGKWQVLDETSASYTATQAGTYMVEVTGTAGCIVNSDPFEITVMSVPTIRMNVIPESFDLGCNPENIPVLTAADFTVNDDSNADAEADVTTNGPEGEGCAKSQTWTATYSNDCGEADPVSITYYWKVDNVAPVIATEAENDKYWGCTVPDAPEFTYTDNCDEDLEISVTTSGPEGGGCDKTQTWTANVSDHCGNPAESVSITYYWKVDNAAPVIFTEAGDNKDWGCTVPDAPEFTYTDNCDEDLEISVTTNGPEGEGCDKSQTWTANVSDHCGNPAESVSITYYWKVDNAAPVIATEAEDDKDWGCTVPDAPEFTYTDNCDEDLEISVTTNGPEGEGCNKSQTWTANVSDHCGNPAEEVSITYTWTEDNDGPVIVPTEFEGIPFGNCQFAIPDLFESLLIYDNCSSVSFVSQNPEAGTLIEQTGEPQTISVTVVVEDACGNPTTTTIDVAIPAKLDVVAEANPTTVNVNGSAVLTATTSDEFGTVTYEWTPAASLDVADAATVTATPTMVGENTYTVTATDENGCEASAMVTVNALNRNVTVSASASKVYDGTPLEVNVEDITIEGLNEGDYLDAGTLYTNDYVVGVYTCPDNSFQFMADEQLAIKSGFVIKNASGDVVTANYTPTFDVTLSITAKAVTITAASGSKRYDGTALTNANVTATGLVAGDELVAQVSGSQTEVGSSPNEIVDYTITRNGRDVTGSYSVTPVNGTLTVFNANIECEGVTYQGYEYPAVQIGNQCWLAENLRNTVYGPEETTAIADYAAYKNDEANMEKFGYLYTWYSAVGVEENNNAAVPETLEGTSLVQGICPEGWVVPSQTDFDILYEFTANEARRLRDMNTMYWIPGEQGVEPNYHFNSRAGGFYNSTSGQFERMLFEDYYWTSTSDPNTTEVTTPMNAYYCNSINFKTSKKSDKRSVRCISAATAYDENAVEPVEPETFRCGTDLILGENHYPTVQIGTQCWTKTNLRETKDKNGNDFINGLTAAAGSFDDDEDAVIYIPTEEKWNVNNSSVTYDENTFGYYYNWVAANNVCPDGWHLPSDEEWNTMEATVSGSDWQTSYETSRGWRGDHAGKLAGGDSWHTSSTANAPGNTTYSGWGASGFSAVPAGLCSGSSFFYAGDCAYFWSSTQDGARNLYYGYAGVSRYYNYKSSRYSVRCLRDAEE